ncbi:HlyD family secretion protein [Sodalis sp. dw_96]|uniref:HlyD family secretion protein n=1 Tax=Sodalis sp. dw_96 TaxID=2719794 RepID=UPI001BD5482C|nr:HlyD family secretion protein [Sodalis sp. dw_96]
MTKNVGNAALDARELKELTKAGTHIRKRVKETLRPILMIGLPVLLAVAGCLYYLGAEPYVSTDNAYARVAKTLINAQVSGQVAKIAVKDNQRVYKGQVLFQINAEPYRIALSQTEAQLNVARLAIEGLKAKYREQQAELQSAKESADFEQKDFLRKKTLVVSQSISRSEYERADTDLKVARQRIASIEQQIANTVVELGGHPDIEVDNHPAVREARSAFDEARLLLSYTTIYAPDDGIVAKVDDLQVGNYINSGAPAFALLSRRQMWVEANFRETEVTHMHVGQDATINIDTYPDRIFKAHVISMSPGAGSDFTLVPPENATGNWVKVVQRVPVRLEFDEPSSDLTLFSGTSATVKVDTGYRGFWAPLFGKLLTAGRRL